MHPPANGPGAAYRALLIGIDAYPARPLRGSVNDIDAVQRLLRQRLGVPAQRIRRLASPHPEARHEDELPSQPATLANLRQALAALADEVCEDDRVLIYYSGHGASMKLAHPDRRTTHREALVAVDVGATPGSGLLYDYELNRVLARIAARTSSLTCILDCCHAAGATRSGLDVARYLSPSRELGWPAVLPAPADLERPAPAPARAGTTRSAEAELAVGLARGVDDCHVVCACQRHELAYETTGQGGVRHGRLTRAFVHALAEIDRGELPDVPWSRIWQAMRADVQSQSPQQHLWMSGNPARAVLAGPPVNGDPGLVLRRVGAVYEIEAGTLASVTEGAELAVYGEQPAYFPRIGSDRDAVSQRGRLHVVSAGPSSAIAEAQGAPFELPPGARGRIVTAGQPARLPCAVVPPHEAIVAALRASPLLEVVDRGARVRLERVGDRWLVTDDLHGPELETALLALTEQDLPRARDVLEHYARYTLPIRLAEAVGDAGALRLCVLACPHALPAEAAQDPELAEASSTASATYELSPGARVCFRVENTRHRRLRVALLNAASSGRVQILGDLTLDGSSSYVFWSHGTLGVPFAVSLPAGRRQGIDRLIAVGTTLLDRDLGYLRVDRRFEDILRVTRDVLPPEPGSARIVEEWTATQAILRTRAR